MNINEKFLYRIVEIDYIKTMGREVSDDRKVNQDLFPFGWFSNTDYDKKIAILDEAIQKKVLIKNTNLYKDFIEDNKGYK